MDGPVFLDANVLFSAAYRSDTHLRELWKLKNTTLCTSQYALAEAIINLETTEQQNRLRVLATQLELFEAGTRALPPAVMLPEKDAPILLAALEARATHLLTGDLKHFGPYLGSRIAGVLVQLPGQFLRTRM